MKLFFWRFTKNFNRLTKWFWHIFTRIWRKKCSKTGKCLSNSNFYHHIKIKNLIKSFRTSRSRGKEIEKLRTPTPKNPCRLVLRTLRRSKNPRRFMLPMFTSSLRNPSMMISLSNSLHSLYILEKLSAKPFNNDFLAQQLARFVHIGNWSILSFIIKLVMPFEQICHFKWNFILN